MNATVTNRKQGIHFLIEATEPHEIFTPEDCNDEHQMIRETIRQFITQDHAPLSDRMEHGELDLNRDLLQKLGELGFLGTHMPEEYGGMDMDTISNAIVTEEIGPTGAFSTTYGAHTGIGMLPILYFGSPEQKQKYLPELITGKKVSCYCLTEPGSGSDALAAKTRADLSADGKHYLLNGQKMWISNAGFADVFIVFAKINGTEFSCFIVEKGMSGISLGAEEKKLGIKGSSTRQVFFENTAVPVENLLGEAGKGHVIAFNVLNTGRYKIGPAALGGTKGLIQVSINYANERHQFGRAISSFGAIQSKIAEQCYMTFAAQSAVYRTAGLIENHIKTLKSEGMVSEKAKLEAAEEFALESSILKVAMTDIVNFVADECVQIHGGMGYSEETRAARGYRDSRIAMIYEGTNEINRMLMINTIFKRAMSGEFDFATSAMAVQQELTSANGHHPELSAEAKAIHNFKKIALMLLGSLGQLALKGKINLKEEQEIMINVADIIIDSYLAESCFLRVQKNPTKTTQAMLVLYLCSANERIRSAALEAIGSFVKEELQAGFIAGVYKFASYPIKNTKELKRLVAADAISKGFFAY